MTPEEFSSCVFDYVIVGGGTAGLVVAAREARCHCRVIEAGEWHPDVDGISIPGMAGSTLGNPQYDWAFMSVPQNHANNRPIYQPRGKGLGGSSMINLLGLSRGSADEYNAIEGLGNTGWNWEGFLKYFKKSETTLPLPTNLPSDSPKLIQPDPEWHGDSGPLVKAYPTHISSFHVPIINGLEELVVPQNFDSSKGNTTGTSTVFCTVDARTASAAMRLMKNLVVLTGSIASRILFRSGTSPLVATGVEFLNGERKYEVEVRKEVIVSAGVFQTPQILELSGIGNKDILSKQGIDTLVDLPGVGENLRETMN
ncbi:glucose-methanol-choline oxidoreductase [Fomes fomentarius]|nr:glucose-methanol-choline oxidoreductase [Fomes fomentarius]